MINSIATNLTSLSIRNNLNASNSKISCTLQRLSTGFKINQTKDDSANSIISSKLDIQLSGLDIVSKNASNGINMLNVADSALENMTNKVSRIRDLAFQALNSTYSTDELSVVQEEINQLIDEIRREKDTTIYNEKKIFDPSTEITSEIKPPEKPYAYEVEYLESTGTQWIDTGIDISSLDYTIKAKAEGTFKFGYVHEWDAGGTWLAGMWSESRNDVRFFYKNYNTVVSKPLDKDSMYTFGLENGKFYNDENSITSVNTGIGKDSISGISMPIFLWHDFKIGATETFAGDIAKCSAFQIYKGDELIRDYIPVIDHDGKAAMYDKISGQMFYNQGTGDFKIGDIIPAEESQFETSIYDNSTTIQIGANDGVDNAITYDLGFNLDGLDINVMSINSSKVAIQKCDELIDTLSLRRSKVGSTMNRIDSIMELQNNNKINLSLTNSLIKDTDYAQESANLAKEQILQEISTSLFSQSHQMTGGLALRLLGVG